jgi:hypothetical protein
VSGSKVKVSPKVFGVEESESIDGFLKFLKFEFSAEERFEQRKRIEYNSVTEFQ